MEELELEGGPLLISPRGSEVWRSLSVVAKPRSRYAALLILCIFLHVFLVLLHVFLLVVYFNAWERSTFVPLGASSTEASTAIVIVSQVFTTLYTAALLLTLQQLALHGDIVRADESLTALHDRVTAWNGLGASLLTLCRQFVLRTTAFGVLGIGAYLFLIGVLHITTPALFTLAAYNQTTLLSVNATSQLPDTQQWSLKEVLTEAGDYPYIEQAVELIPALSVFIDAETTIPGLVGATVYSSLADNNGAGEVSVPAATFLVECGIMEIVDAVMANETSYTVNLTVAGLEGCRVSLSLKAEVGPPITFTAVTCLNNTVAFTGVGGGSFLADMEGDGVPQLNLSQWIPDNPWTSSVVGCNIHLNEYEVLVDAQTKIIVSEPVQRQNSTWTAWAPPEQNSDLESLLTALVWVGTTAVDTFVAERMGLRLDSEGDVIGVLMGTKLQLEEALGNLSAATAWIVHAAPADDDLPLGNETETALATVVIVDTVNQLQIRIEDLVAGFAVSLLLLALAIHLSWPTRTSIDRSNLPDTLGVLQVLWLAGRTPSVARGLANRALDPSVQSLRRAGMVDRQAGLLGVESRSSVDGRFVSW